MKNSKRCGYTRRIYTNSFCIATICTLNRRQVSYARCTCVRASVAESAQVTKGGVQFPCVATSAIV